MARRYHLMDYEMKMLKFVLGLCLVAAATAAPLPGENLIFEDNFNYLDLSKWKHDITLTGGGNWEFQAYWNNRTNSFVKNGVLHLKPTLTSGLLGENNVQGGYRWDFWGSNDADRCTSNLMYGCERTSGGNVLNPILSAKLTSGSMFKFRYGRVEIRAKLPKGDWIWPAIWMLPYYNAYGNWPASGEIDIMESRGNVNYPDSAGGGCNSFGSTLHWGVDFYSNKYPLTHKVYKHFSGTLADDFHVYGLYWDGTKLYTYIDDESQKVLSVDFSKESFWSRGKFNDYYHNPWEGRPNSAPFDQEFFLIMNVAIGGTAGYFPDGVGGKPWSDQSSAASNQFWNARGAWLPTWVGDDVAMKIDYVRVYSLPTY